MTKALGLLAALIAFNGTFAHADIVASGEETDVVATNQVAQQELHVYFEYADLIDTGKVMSKGELMIPQTVASDRVAAPPEGCHIYTTRASFYGSGARVAYHSQRFNPNGDSMATLNLRLGSEVYVRMPGSGEWTKGVANDRGPYVGGRGADLSVGYARDIGFPMGRGVAPIQVAACGGGDAPTYTAGRHHRRKG